MTKCNKCNTDNSVNAKFCVSCGNPLKEIVSASKKATSSVNTEDPNVEISVNFDFAKKGLGFFKSLSKNQQVLSMLTLVAITSFFIKSVTSSDGGLSIYNMIYFLNDSMYGDAKGAVKYLWSVLIIPVIIGLLVYLYNFHCKSSFQRLKILLGINFLTTSVIVILSFIWFPLSTALRLGGELQFMLGWYLYFFSFIGMFAISVIEVINLFRKR